MNKIISLIFFIVGIISFIISQNLEYTNGMLGGLAILLIANYTKE